MSSRTAAAAAAAAAPAPSSEIPAAALAVPAPTTAAAAATTAASADALFDINAYKTINWDEAIEQAGGDEEFLNEVLNDLLNETTAAVTEIETAIEGVNFNGVMQAAHRIKGSSSYLSCEALKEVSLLLQDTGRAGMNAPADKLWDDIKILFVHFKTCFANLQTEVKTKF